ncbi:MAG: type I methionyl aminopeptidase, partial [Dehalococcoidia bacterium]
MSVELKSSHEIEVMRQSGRINAEVRALLCEAIRPGVTGIELDRLAKEAIAERDAFPTFVGYAPHGKPPYPGAICFSVNEELVHGIPTERALVEGDIVSIDLGVTYGGYVSDAAFTAPVGEVPAEVRALLDATRDALWAGIHAAQAGNRLGDVSAAIGGKAQCRPAVDGRETEGAYGIVRGYGGHGVGRKMHMEPHVPNYGTPGKGLKLLPGMVLALEPMF